MSKGRYEFQYQEQLMQSNITQFLNIGTQKLIDQCTKKEFQANQFKQITLNPREQSQRKMNDEQAKIDRSESQSLNGDSQESIHELTSKRKYNKRLKNKEGINKNYSKIYRQKQREKQKSLQEENRFLKSKIDDLKFRLKQTELQLNRLKYNTLPNANSSLQSTRETLLNQIHQTLTKQDLQIQKLIQLQAQINKTSSFDCQHRRDLANYFMSELLENLINDMGFYFIDSLVSQKGLWKGPESPGREIDYEVCQIFGISDFQGLKKLLYSQPHFGQILKNYKNQWKKLYQDYLKIVHLGNMVEAFNRPLLQRVNKVDLRGRVFRSLKLEIYFEKIKYRKDMRQLRQSWFHEIQNEKNIAKIIQK